MWIQKFSFERNKESEDSAFQGINSIGMYKFKSYMRYQWMIVLKEVEEGEEEEFQLYFSVLIIIIG